MEDFQTDNTTLLRSFNRDELCVDVLKDEPSGCPMVEISIEHSRKGYCHLVTLCPCRTHILKELLHEAGEFVETLMDE